MIERERGRAALVATVRGYRDGLETPAVLTSVLGLSPQALDRHFADWLRTRFAGPLAAVDPWDGKGPVGGEFTGLLRSARGLVQAGDSAGARRALERAEALFPEYAWPRVFQKGRGTARGGAQTTA